LRWNAARSAAVDQPATGLSDGAAIVPSRTTLLAGLLLEIHAALEHTSITGGSRRQEDVACGHGQLHDQ